MDFEQAPWDDAVSIGPAKQEEEERKGLRKERGRLQRTTTAHFEDLDVDAGPLGPLSTRPDSPVEPPPTHSQSPMPPPPKAPSVREEVRERDPARETRSKPVQTPKFDITVGDPHKIGDITSAHIVYKVTTRTDSKAFRGGEVSVTRRYRDFRWLYDILNTSNPGTVIPPPPDKQAMGRFGEDFVETRRTALERMLQKCATHPTLQHDSDFKIFLESEAFHVDVKQKELQRSGSLEGKGFMSSLGAAVPTMPTFGGSGKFVEHDEWFHERKITLDALENQLKALNKAVDGVMKQRKELADATGEFGAALSRVAATELTFSLSTAFSLLSDLQFRIKELQERQTQQELLTIGTTVDEYLRLVDSAKVAIGQRHKAYFTWQGAEADLVKRKAAFDKTRRSGKTQQDRLAQMSAELGDVERKCHQLRLQFEDMGRLLKQELARIDMEKVEDFKSSIETFLESVVEGQKELIEHWETFLLRFDQEIEPEPEPALVQVTNIADTPSAVMDHVDMDAGEAKGESAPPPPPPPIEP